MIGNLQKIISLILVTVIISLCGNIKMQEDSSLKTISDKFCDGLINGTISPFASSDVDDANSLMSLIAEDSNGGLYFKDVDYNNRDRAVWQAAGHLTRAERLSILFRRETNPDIKEKYKSAVLGLIDYWTNKDYQNPNWWHNKLSNPNIIGEIGILMKEHLSQKQIRDISALVGRGCYSIDPSLYIYTGANAIDIAFSSIKFGVLTGYSPAVRSALSVVSGALDYSLSEGIKKDGTFFQHGNRLYMGGYGIDFIKSVSKIIYMISDTDLMFSEHQLEAFSRFLLTGLKTMSFGNTLDPTVMGRSVSRMNSQPLLGIVAYLVLLAEAENMPGRAELMNYANTIANNTKQSYGLHYFEKAKFLVINNEDFYFSFRGGDNLIFYSEITNDENILSYNSSYPGVTTIMRTGKEYANISPLYDYSFVPGTTAVYETDSELADHCDTTYRILPGLYGSSVTDSEAIVFVKTNHEGIDMTVTCFATDNSALLLGAGLKDKNGRPMNTTIDQSFYTGSHIQNGNTVIHNGIKYELLEGGTLSAENERRIGSWRRNNLTLPDVFEQGDIFTIYTENTGSYAYTVMSENTCEEFEVIINTPSVQAVKMPSGKIAASFFASTHFAFEGKTYTGEIGKSYFFDAR